LEGLAVNTLEARRGDASYVTIGREDLFLDDDVPVLLPIGDELDLHAFAPRDVPSVVEEYLASCSEKGLLRVRLVHGRGKGVQRAVVRRLLARLEIVQAFSDAPAESGGWGATLVELKGRDG
jgi:DNA-nicking Smr family endonuclease